MAAHLSGRIVATGRESSDSLLRLHEECVLTALHRRRSQSRSSAPEAMPPLLPRIPKVPVLFSTCDLVFCQRVCTGGGRVPLLTYLNALGALVTGDSAH